MNYKGKNQAVGVVAFFCGLVGFFNALKMNPESAFWPKVILLITMILGVLLFFTNTKYFYRNEEVKKNKNLNILNIYKYKHITLFLIFVVIYIMSIEPIGYVIVTPVFLLITGYLLELRNVKIAILYPIIVSVSIFVVFKIIFKLPIPMGILKYLGIY